MKRWKQGLIEATMMITSYLLLEFRLICLIKTSQSGYERVNGEINFEGKVYKYVKRIVQNDTMTLLCIPHEEKAKLQQSANNYFGGVNDLAGNTGNSSKKSGCSKTVAYRV